jgi:hypothetical protein
MPSMRGHLGELPAGPAASTTEVEDDVNGGPLGALSVGPVASTTEVADDVDDAPPGGCCQRVLQRPPPSLKMMSMVAPLMGAAGGSGSVHHRV